MNTDQFASELLAQTEQTDPLAFFNTVYETYKKAEAASGEAIDRFYSIAGFKIRLRFAGAALIPYMTPALAHLATEPVSDPALTVCLWDSASTSTLMPPPPWKTDDYRERGEIRGFSNERIHTTFQWGASALSILDTEQNLATYWVKTVEQIPYWETGAPLRTIFHSWMSKRGIQLVHGGAVGIPSGGVLLVGKGGSGKSTTALSCLNSELFYASDDYCLLTSEPTPTVFSIYSTGKKNADDVQRLPFLKSLISNPERLDSEKALYFINEHFPEKILSSCPLRAILIPRITGEAKTTLKAASPAMGLAALAPSTIFQLPGADKEAFQSMGKVVRQVQCYSLNLGTDIGQVPKVILELLSRS